MKKSKEKDFYDACWNEIETRKNNNNINKVTNIKKSKKNSENKSKKVLKIITIAIALIYTIRFLLRPDIYPLILYIIVQFFTFK